MAKKNKKLTISKAVLHKMEMGRIRDEKKSAGFFDGRFNQRTEKDKSKYTRKKKHKNKDW